MTASGSRALDRLALWGPALGLLALHVAFATTYGIFRDELYYLSCARRLAWGYVDHPPLVAGLTALWTALFGDGLRALRVLPALAVAGAAALVGSTARVLGGGRFAVALAGTAFALSPIVLSLGSILSMNAFDLLFWAAAIRLLAALLSGGDPRLWIAFGAVAGLGLLNKASMLLLGFGLVVGLLVDRRWEPFRNRYFWLGGLVAAALVAPHLVWQAQTGWTTLEFMDNARRLKNVELAVGDFLVEQLMGNSPVGAIIWLAGLGVLLAARAFGPWRSLGLAWLAVLGVMLSTAAKPYYLTAAFAPLWAAGAVAIERWTASGRASLAIRSVLAATLLGLAAAAAPLARPVLPVERYVAYAAALGESPGTDERKEVGRLPQFFADMQEWRELAEAVGRAAGRLSPEERGAACVFGQNYGEAGAVEHFGAALGLPPAISAHNSWFLWGPGACTGEVLLVIGRDRERLDQLFDRVEAGAVWDCRDCMPYEDGLTVWIARGPRASIATIWPEIKNFS